MSENNKLILARNGMVGAAELLCISGSNELLIAELDDRFELTVLLLSDNIDTNALVCGGGNTNCAGANCHAGCT